MITSAAVYITVSEGDSEPCDDAAARACNNLGTSFNYMSYNIGNMGMRLKSISKQANTAT